MKMPSLLRMTYKWMSYWITRDRWGFEGKAMFCDQSTVFYLWWGQPRAVGPSSKGPFTETQTRASEGIMCSVDAQTVDTHRISPLWCRTVKLCDSWPVVNFHHYVLQCKSKQQSFPQTFLSVRGWKNLTVFRLMIPMLCDASMNSCKFI